jgi:hypothetical protein
MNEQEFKAFLAAIERFNAQHTGSPEAARKMLQQEGVLTETGEIAEPYAPVRAPDVG